MPVGMRGLRLLPALALLAVLTALAGGLALPGPVAAQEAEDQDFDLPNNAAPTGIAWDGTHLRVVNNGADKVYAYDSSGGFVSSFKLNSENTGPQGITWDGTYLRVVDFTTDKVYSYDSSGSYRGSFDLYSVNRDPYGITWDGTYLRVVDNSADRVYAYDSSGSYVSSFSLESGNGFPRGITWDGTYLRVSDFIADRVYAYDSSGSYLSSFRQASGSAYSQGIAWDGTYLRVVDTTADKVFAYDSSESYLSDQDFNLFFISNAQAITWDGTYLRVVDSNTDKVYAYDSSGSYIGDQEFSLVAANAYPSAITWDGTYLRVVDSNTDKVYAYDSSGSYVSSFGLDSGNTAPAGITWDGTYLRVVDSNTDKVYAYDSSGSYIGDQEFSLVAANKTPSGITWDGTYLRVVDSNTDKVYAYDSSGSYIGDQEFSLVAANAYPSGITWDGTYLRVVDYVGNRVHAYDPLRVISGTADSPTDLAASRSDDYGTVILSWEATENLVSEYEIERLEATAVSAGDSQRLEYGNLEQFTVRGLFPGVAQYADNTVSARSTYQYRIRAQGAEDAWSEWSSYVFSGQRPDFTIDAPSNVALARSPDNTSVTVSWTAPQGEFDNYTLQRQELVVAQGSSFFANTVTFPATSGTWLPSSSTSYTDSSMLPGRIYEYRVAVVKDDLVGDYTDWSRTTSFETGFGEAPERFRKTSEVIRPDRAEYWLEWKEVDGADDYELDLVVFDPTTGRRSLRQGIVVTDPTYFSTAYGRSEYRVRGRKQDASLCGSGAGDRCLTPWSGWLSQGFVARQRTVGQPPSLETPPTPDASTLELRAALDAALEESLAPAGLSFDPGGIINFVWLAFGAVVAGLVYDDGRRQGMAPFAFAVGVTFYVIYLWLGVRLVDLPQTWGVMALVVILVGGGVATAKSLGLLGR